MKRRALIAGICLSLFGLAVARPAAADDKTITIGFAVAFSGWEAAYDAEATKMAKLWIDQTNAAGGLLGKQIKVLEADTKSDRAEGAKAGQRMVEGGASLVFVTADYDYGAPAALQASKAGRMSVFLAASDPKAGIFGVGPLAFTTTDAGQTEGATMAEWGYTQKGYRRGYVLLDENLEYNKSVCAGYEWAFAKAGGKIVGRDTFKNGDATVSSQVTRLADAVRNGGVDNIMLCTVTPGGASAIRQIRAAGINTPILNGSGMDGSYWLGAVPNLSNFYVPVQAAVVGDPNADVNALTAAYKKKYGAAPSTQYAYPVYAFLQLWAKAVNETKSSDPVVITKKLETYKDVPTVLGPRTFSSTSHIQTRVLLSIVETNNGVQKVVGTWRLSTDIPNQVLYRMKAAGN
ncbi:ABC transporter substrate-binding protein [Paraburkholderia bannensis]|uniref:ABC transporter substrate-binding protein n=1 Tax=Paraburkholderia bannensis TaxID=765414 RepID=UPI002AB5EE2B|nr:ABC transporter substrate-binding protein [Paraburkholderia bannensis]